MTIAGSVCDVQSVNDTQVICVTNSQPRSQLTKVLVNVGNRGIAQMVILSSHTFNNQIFRNLILEKDICENSSRSTVPELHLLILYIYIILYIILTNYTYYVSELILNSAFSEIMYTNIHIYTKIYK